MLKNELQIVKGLFLDSHNITRENFLGIDLPGICQEIQQAWLNVFFSDIPHEQLVRYFHYHLKGLSEISDTLQGFPVDERMEVLKRLLALIDHLRAYYADYLDPGSNAPLAYRDRVIGQMSGDIALIRLALNKGRLSPELTMCIINWLNEITANQDNLRYTFRSLDYTTAAITELAGLSWQSPDVEDLLVTVLIRINYNDLAFLKYLQRRLLENANQFETASLSLSYLWKQRAELMAIPQRQTAYDLSWPSVKVMMGEWLNERITLTLLLEKTQGCVVNDSNEGKLTLNLSVAYLACLIKLLYEEEVFGTQSLSSIFQFFSAHFKTRKQPLISARSLSKEFYSIDLHTAAHIRALLQKMIAQINRNFFPVLAVINIAICFYRGSR